MNEKPKRRAAAASWNLAEGFSQLAGTQQLGAELMASVARTKGVGESFAGIQRQGAQLMAGYARNHGMAAQLVAGYARNHGMAAQLVRTFASTQGLSAQLTGSFAGTQGLMGDMSGVRALVQGLAPQMAPWAGISLIDTVRPDGELPRVADFLPPTLRNWDMSQVVRPLLETSEYRHLGDAGEDLAEWVEERFSGAETASTERFEEIAGRLENVELDEESEQQLERMAQDETALQAAAIILGFPRFVPQTLGGVLALSAAVSIAVSLMLVVGTVFAPALTEIIVASVGKGLAAGGGTYLLTIRFSPGARAQLDAMKRTDPGTEADSGDTEET